MQGWILALISLAASGLILAGCGSQGFRAAQISHNGSNDAAATNPGSGGAEPPLADKSLIEQYQARYPLDDTHTKLVNNRGDGFEKLYGTRNLRAVLNGVVYRGGANNSNNKFDKRDNRNPLPNVGLQNLCKEGFSEAVYLYSTNFASAAKTTSCESLNDSKHTLNYAQNSPYNSAGIKAMFTKIMTTIENPKVGPIYLHCWNGWHASGLISALILRQFCGYTGAEASAYWDLNTDGNNTDPAFASIRKAITSFVPYPEFEISNATRAMICAGR